MVNNIVVIGAGIVGVSTALSLLKRGFSVTLVDRKAPGRETSYGNSGIITRYAVTPFNEPGLWSMLPTYVRNTSPALRYRPAYVAKNLSWFARYLANATVARTLSRAKALDGLISLSCEIHRRWIIETGVSHRMRDIGTLKLWRSETSRDKAQAARNYLLKFGLDAPLLSAGDISELEPDINPIFSVGLFNKDSASVDSPGCITEAYAQSFVAQGGILLTEFVSWIAQRPEDGWRVYLPNAELDADAVVLALGPWSADFLKPLGYRVPLAFERGYHQEYTLPQYYQLSRPIYDADNSYIMSPMNQGIRITTGVEMADRDAPPNLSQRDAALVSARGVLPIGEAVAEPWLGSRPTLPDCLPIIGEAPRHPNLWLGFGHQHIGFTTGPGTGHLLAQLISKHPSDIDFQAFRPGRYL